MTSASGAEPSGAAPPPTVAVAVSGGRDSIALLHATQRVAPALGVRVVALHVHHGLMPEADAWAAGVEAFCVRAGIAFGCLRLDGAPAAGESVEAWARRERYAALARGARAAGATLVLQAHHRRDQAETVLLQALRGAGPAGLAAMPRTSERAGLTWARPWLDVPDEAVGRYADDAGLAFVHDPSNADPRFARSRLRLTVMPVLRDRFDDAEQALVAVAVRAQEARAVLDEVAAEDLARLGAGPRLPLTEWRGLSPARRSNALRAWLAAQHAGALPETLVRRVLAQAVDDAPRRWPLDAAHELRSWRGQLAIGRRAIALRLPAPEAVVLRLSQPDLVAVPGWPGRLEVVATLHAGIPPACLAEVTARPRAGGERFVRAPGGTARSLKKQFQEAGIPADEREGPLVFDARGRLLFVPGLGMDARLWAAPGAPQWAIRWHPYAGEEG